MEWGCGPLERRWMVRLHLWLLLLLLCLPAVQLIQAQDSPPRQPPPPPPEVVLPAVTTYGPAWELYGTSYFRPWYIAAYPAQDGVRPSVLLWDAGDHTTLYRLDDAIGARAVLNGTTGGWQMSHFETRPQVSERGLVWVSAFNRTSAPDVTPATYQTALLAFDAASLKLSRTLLLPVLNPALSDYRHGSLYLCTDSAGMLFLSRAEAIYVLDPVTGLQTTHFNLTVMDQLPADRSHDGYHIGFTKDDVMWAVDTQWVNQSLGMMRSRRDGTIIGQAYVELPYTAQNRLEGFAVDSAGNAYIGLYSDDALQSRAYVISPSFAVTFLAAPFASNIVDLEISIAWGATPAEDLIVQYDFYTKQVSVQHPSGDVVTSINPLGVSGLSLGPSQLMLYDPYQDSLLLVHNRGVARLSLTAYILAQYRVSSISTAPSSVAADGFGNVLVVVSALAQQTPFPPSFPGASLPFDFYLFAPNTSLLLCLVNASTSSYVVLDGARSVIWTANSTGMFSANPSFRLFSVSYVTGQSSPSLPVIFGSLQQMVAYDSTRLAVLVNSRQDNVYNSVYLVTTATGTLSLLVAVDRSSQYLTSSTFSLSLDHSLLYLYGRANDFSGSLGYIVSVPSGEVIAAVEPAYASSVFNAQNLLVGYGGPLLIWDSFTLPEPEQPPPEVVLPAVTTYGPAWELYGTPYFRPWYIAAYPAQDGVRPSVLLWDAGDHTTLYRLDDAIGARAVLNGTTGGWQMSHFETRPQVSERGLVWVSAFNRTSAPDVTPATYQTALLAFDAASLKLSRTLLLPVLNPALSDYRHGSLYLCTDSAGMLFLSRAEAIYVLDPVTGLQTTHFNLTVMDQLPADRSHDGYHIGFTKDDVMWAVDTQWVNQSLGMMRSRRDGTIIGQAYVELPYTAQNRLEGFAVDSAGNAYIGLYSDDALQSRAYVISPSFAVTFLAAPFASNIVDLEISIAWGATPAEDLIVQYDFYTKQVSVQHPSGNVVSAIYPAGADAFGGGYDMAYDPYQDSLVMIHDGGAARLSMKRDLITLYSITTLHSNGGPSAGAVDGLGRVLVAVTWDWTSFNGPFDLYLYAADATLLWRLQNATNTNCIVLDGMRSVIWMTEAFNINNPALTSFTLYPLAHNDTGITHRGPELTVIQGLPQKLAVYDATRLAVLVYDGRDERYNTVLLVSTVTGATSLLFSLDPTGSFLIGLSFSLSQDHSLAYIYGFSKDLRQELGYVVSLPAGELVTAVEPAYSNNVFNAQTMLCAYGGPLVIWELFPLPQSREEGVGSGGSRLSGGVIAGIVVGVVGVALVALLLALLVCRRGTGTAQKEGGEFGSIKEEEPEVELQ